MQKQLSFKPEISDKNAVGVALVATALKIGINLGEWAQGNKKATTWTKKLAIIDNNLSKKIEDVLDDWSLSEKSAIVDYARTRLDDMPDFFAELRLVEEENDAKIRGAIYTPSWLSNRIAKNTFDHWRRLHRSGKQPALIADVSCGVGSFLHQANKFFGTSPKYVGIDIDSKALIYSRLLSQSLGSSWDLISDDSLLRDTHQLSLLDNTDSLLGTADILLGNPPYVRSQLLDRKYSEKLRNLYSDVAQGNFDLSVLFLDHAIRFLREGGIASYILSSKFMVSKYGEAICKKLASDVRILNIEDFGDSQLFEGRTTYTCVLTFAKMPPTKRFTVTTYPTGISNAASIVKGQSFTLLSERLNSHPWDFANGEEQSALNKLRDTKNPLLTEVFTTIIQGVRTGANQVFLVDSESVDIEPELLLPFVSGEDIRRLNYKTNKYKLLFPYRKSAFGEQIPLVESEIKQKYPKAWVYLNSKKSILLERSIEKGTEWFSYSRTQNLNSSSVKKMLVREMMPRAEFAADLKGELSFSSGYALVANRMDDKELILWTAVLNTPTMEFNLRRNGTQLHSGWFRLLKHHLNRVRLPLFDTQSKALAAKIALDLSQNPENTQLWKKLDNIVSNSFGLESGERESLLGFLASCHERSLSEDKQTIQLSNKDTGYNLKYEPSRLEEYDTIHVDRPELRRLVTFIESKNLPLHRWYPLTQGFSETLVKMLLEDLGASKSATILDPFAGCGTTNLTCRLNEIKSIGVEISPLMVWLTKAKTRIWDREEISRVIKSVKDSKIQSKKTGNLHFQEFLGKAYAPQILSQLVGIAEFAKQSKFSAAQKDFLLVGLIGITEQVSMIRKHGSHYRYMNASENIGLQKLNTQLISPEADVKQIYIEKLEQMLDDVIDQPIHPGAPACVVVRGDARKIALANSTVDLVITSPPYLNRNNYIAQQKTELALLDLVASSDAYRELVQQTLRSHVESRLDRTPKSSYEEVRKIVEALVLTENNNPKIPHMIAGYFEDLGMVLNELGRVVKKGGKCAFVVANSRWGGVVVPVDHLIAKIAEQNGFKALRILVTRLKGNSPQQMRRYGRIPLRESIVVLQKV